MHHHGNSVCITVVTQYVYIIVLTYISVEQYGISYTVQIFLLHYCDITISLRYELKEHFQLKNKLFGTCLPLVAALILLV